MGLTKIDDRGLNTPIDLLDNEKIRFGTGNDLEVYHSGNHSFIKDTGTGNLAICGSKIEFLNAAVDEVGISFIQNAGVGLYFDNSVKFETTSTGVQVVNGTGDAQLTIRGGASDGRSTLTFISDDAAANSDNWRLHNDANNDFYLQNYESGGWETNIKTVGGGAVELYFDNVKKLQTNSTYGTIFSNTTDNAAYTNALLLTRRGYEASGYGAVLQAKGGSASSQNGLNIQISNASSYVNKVSIDGDGLKFNGDTAAANALDDYEEGTWTPTTHDGSVSTSNARYVKVGRQVTIWAHVSNFSDRSTNDEVKIGSLPFASESNGAKGSAMYRFCNESARTVIYMNSSSQMFLYGGETGNYTQVRHNELNDANFEIYLMATYDAD